MVCHSCCDEITIPKVCPSCTAPALRFLGAGSQRVEEILSAVVPQAKVGRMDSDTMMRREDYEETLSAFGRGELDVLVGTQMIAKGRSQRPERASLSESHTWTLRRITKH